MILEAWAASPPPTPTDFLVWPSADKKVHLRWNASSGATGYEVYRNSSLTADFIPLTPSPRPETSFTDASSSLVEGIKYSYRIVAVNGSGISKPTAALSATPYTPMSAENISWSLLISIIISIAVIWGFYLLLRFRRIKKLKANAIKTGRELAAAAQPTPLLSADERETLATSEDIQKRLKEEEANSLKVWKFWNIIRGDDWFPSLALFQFFLWTIIILFSFMFITFIKIQHVLLAPVGGLNSPMILLLMGISTATPIVSGSISSIKYSQSNPSDPPKDLPSLRTMLEESGKPSLTRFQMFAWTWVSIIIFLMSVYVMITNNVSQVNQLSLPDVDPVLVVLMGLSQTAYVGGKAYSKAAGITEIYPRVIKKESISNDGQLVSIFGSGFGTNVSRGIVWIGQEYFEYPGIEKTPPKRKIVEWQDNDRSQNSRGFFAKLPLRQSVGSRGLA